MLKRKTIKVNRVDVDYYYGGKGRNVLFLHGLGVSPKNYLDLLNSLSKKYSVHAPIMPGHAGTDFQSKDVDVNFYTNIVLGLIKQLKLQNVVIVGTSMGGLLTLAVASKNPKEVSKIIPINAAGIKIERPILPLTVLAAYDLLVKVNNPKKFKRAIRLLNTIFSSSFKLLDKRGRQLLFSIIKKDHQTKIREIKIPTTIIWAKSDLCLPVSNAYQMKDLIPNSNLVLVEDENHPWVELDPKLAYEVLIKNI